MFTHVDSKNNPKMVDVSGKEESQKTAVAEGVVYLPAEVDKHFIDNEINTKKGPVFQTAIIAGTMGAKSTSQLIPFCHPLPLESCRIEVAHQGKQTIKITCSVRTTHKTGVEMEALMGVNIAALTVYDMCKALSHKITIGEIKLVKKTGGRSDFGK